MYNLLTCVFEVIVVCFLPHEMMNTFLDDLYCNSKVNMITSILLKHLLLKCTEKKYQAYNRKGQYIFDEWKINL